LKVDCEGSEVFIFIEENTEFFRTNVHKIALEFHNEKKDDITKFLSDAGYEVHVDNGKDNLGMLYAKNIHFKKAVFAYPVVLKNWVAIMPPLDNSNSIAH
jgi:hypothetical protein